jgi:hypothetical protein
MKRLILLLLAVGAPLTATAATINVFLVGGQSNAAGQGEAAGLTGSYAELGSQSDVLYYLNGTKIAALQPWNNLFGPELAFGCAMADYYADSGGQVAILKYAAAGTNLYDQWKPGTGSVYNSFITNIDTSLASLAGGNTIVIQGMIWMQGESDAVGGYSEQYGANLAAFIADMRLHYGAELRFVIGELSVNQTTLSMPLRGDVREGQEAVAAADPLTGLISTDGFSLKVDNLHFDTNGQLDMGAAFGMEMQRLLAIPEPSAWILLGIGVALLAVTRRKFVSSKVAGVVWSYTK